jgi:pyruvate/2-oxoglutarate dehydrogenase complex dihydrolipoamide acyltransferase (E2) component
VSSEGPNPQNRSGSPQEGPDERALSGREYDGYLTDRGEETAAGDRDLVLNVPEAKVEELGLEVERLNARISLQAELADLVRINVGFDVDLDQARLKVKGVEARASLEAHLENVREIFGQVMDAVSSDPRVLEGFVEMMEGSSRLLSGAAGKVGSESSPDAEEPRTDAPRADVSGDGGEVKATEAARRKARELGVNLGDVRGTGSGGRVVIKDVVRAAKRR